MTTVIMTVTIMDTLTEQKYVTLAPATFPSAVQATRGQLHKGVLPTLHTAHVLFLSLSVFFQD